MNQKMSNELDWGLIDEISRHGQNIQRGLNSHSLEWLSSPEASQQPLFMGWLSSQLHLKGNIDSCSDGVPPCELHIWKGWLSHHAGHFEQAHAHFSQAWALRQPAVDQEPLVQPVVVGKEALIALGLGRTHLRSGHWEHAKGWLLYGLSVARRAGDEATVFKSYGALGELFIRASAATEGFTSLNLAYRLLPAGSGQRARQLNYLGTALGRLHEHLRAQSVLMTSFYMSKDGGDAVSKWHALARLQHLNLQCPPGIRLSEENLDELAQGIESAPPVARGYWRLAKARSIMAIDRASPQAAEWLKAAYDDFLTANAPMEQAWAGLWIHHHCADAQPWQATLASVQALMDLPAVEPPEPIGVLDRGFAQPQLARHRAFQALLQLPTHQNELDQMDQLFFF